MINKDHFKEDAINTWVSRGIGNVDKYNIKNGKLCKLEYIYLPKSIERITSSNNNFYFTTYEKPNCICFQPYWIGKESFDDMVQENAYESFIYQNYRSIDLDESLEVQCLESTNKYLYAFISNKNTRKLYLHRWNIQLFGSLPVREATVFEITGLSQSLKNDKLKFNIVISKNDYEYVFIQKVNIAVYISKIIEKQKTIHMKEIDKLKAIFANSKKVLIAFDRNCSSEEYISLWIINGTHGKLCEYQHFLSQKKESKIINLHVKKKDIFMKAEYLESTKINFPSVRTNENLISNKILIFSVTNSNMVYLITSLEKKNDLNVAPLIDCNNNNAVSNETNEILNKIELIDYIYAVDTLDNKILIIGDTYNEAWYCVVYPSISVKQSDDVLKIGGRHNAKYKHKIYNS